TELFLAVARGMLMFDVLRPQQMTAAERRERQLEVTRTLWRLLFKPEAELAYALRGKKYFKCSNAIDCGAKVKQESLHFDQSVHRLFDLCSLHQSVAVLKNDEQPGE